MAQMYPRTLHAPDVKSAAERRVFDRLAEALDENWEVFHSVSWMLHRAGHGSFDGEIDFVLCHPNEGIVCLEVKGGGLECQHGEWYRLEKGERKRMEDPFQQARDHRYDLKRQLGGLPKKSGREFFLAHGLVFPDISVHKLALAPDAPRQIVLDRNDLDEIDSGVQRILEYHRGSGEKRERPGKLGAKKLRELLAADIRIEIPMAARILDEEEDMVTLTHDQANLLVRFAGNNRMLIRGCAGSGKTMLGVEHAKRLARQDREVLFVCFNRALRDHLKDREKDSAVTFHTFHGLCAALAKKARVELPDHNGDPPQSYWREELPAALMEAADILGPQADAVVVDEAQDLHPDWLDALFSVLRDPDGDLVWLFMDANQDVYEIQLEPPKDFVTFDLTVNCRNTQAIAREVHKRYHGEVTPEVLGPPGRDPELILTDDQPEVVAAVIHRLCGEEEIPPQDVVVLSSHGMEKSAVAESGAGRFTFTDEYKPLGNYIRFSSIRGFKGLESPVVILCELEDIGEETRDQQLYVGISRARNHCVVVAPGTRS